jgi:thiamine-phosphate pyrophosphorylase
VTRAVSTPVLAIGGITAGQVPAVRARGAQGTAVVAAILEASDPRGAACVLRDAVGDR